MTSGKKKRVMHKKRNFCDFCFSNFFLFYESTDKLKDCFRTINLYILKFNIVINNLNIVIINC